MVNFSKRSYFDIIGAALKSGYNCTTFKNRKQTQSPVMILRHDVDFSLDYAVTMAEWESEMGVSSTYFIMTTCEHYNTISPKSREKLAQLVSLGHEVGLHWDSSTYATDSSKIRATFKRELAVLGDCAGHEITSASQHIPTDNPNYKIEDLVEIEAYSDEIKDHFDYVSDSSMQWRAKTPYDLIATGKDIQFLSHPIWWTTSAGTADDKLRELGKHIAADQSEVLEDFIAYMNKVLGKRESYDKAFKEKRGWTDNT